MCVGLKPNAVKSQPSPKLPKEATIHPLAEDQTRITRRSESSGIRRGPQTLGTLCVPTNAEYGRDRTLQFRTEYRDERQYA